MFVGDNSNTPFLSAGHNADINVALSGNDSLRIFVPLNGFANLNLPTASQNISGITSIVVDGSGSLRVTTPGLNYRNRWTVNPSTRLIANGSISTLGDTSFPLLGGWMTLNGGTLEMSAAFSTGSNRQFNITNNIFLVSG